MSAAYDAALAFLRAQGLTVYDGQPGSRPEDPQPAPTPYVAVYSDDGRRTSDRLQATPNRADEHLRILSVGVDAAQVRWVRVRVKSLAGQRINGELVTHTVAASVHADDEVPGSLLSAYDLFTIPAGVTNA